MTQILDSINRNEDESILCCYVNATSQIQVARITNISNWYFERVVFPGQRLVFEAFPEGLLEIHTGMMASAILSDTIPCKRLCVNEDSNQSNEDDELSSTVSQQKESISMSESSKKTLVAVA